ALCRRVSLISSLLPYTTLFRSRHVLKEMLYLVALAGSSGPRATELRQVFNLTPLPFTDNMLEEGYQRLAGPGLAVMRSLSTAIRDRKSTRLNSSHVKISYAVFC